MTKILSDKYPLLLILHLARLSCSCDLVTCVCTHHKHNLKRSRSVMVYMLACSGISHKQEPLSHKTMVLGVNISHLQDHAWSYIQ